MNYVYILIADILLGAIFVLNKKYQQYQGSGLAAGLKSNVIIGAVGFLIFFTVSGFRISVTPFSFLMATLTTLSGVIYTVIGLKILSGGKVAIYAMFLMSGGMLLPFLFGAIFMDEDITLWHIIGAVLIIAAIAISNFDRIKPTKKQIAMSVTVFFLNGFLGIFSKIHQTAKEYETISTESFVAIGNLIKTVICLIALITVTLIANRGKERAVGDAVAKVNTKDAVIPYVLLFLVAAADCVSYFCQLKGAVDIPATVLFPLVSGGSIVMTAAVGMLVLKEKPTKSAIIGMAVCTLGMCMFI